MTGRLSLASALPCPTDAIPLVPPSQFQLHHPRAAIHRRALHTAADPRGCGADGGSQSHLPVPRLQEGKRLHDRGLPFAPAHRQSSSAAPRHGSDGQRSRVLNRLPIRRALQPSLQKRKRGSAVGIPAASPRGASCRGASPIVIRNWRGQYMQNDFFTALRAQPGRTANLMEEPRLFALNRTPSNFTNA